MHVIKASSTLHATSARKHQCKIDFATGNLLLLYYSFGASKGSCSQGQHSLPEQTDNHGGSTAASNL